MVAPLMAGSPLKALTCKLTNRRAPDAWARFQRSEISTYSSPVRVRTTLTRSFWSSVRSRKARSRVISFSITLPTTTPGSQSWVGSLVGLPPCPGSIAITYGEGMVNEGSAAAARAVGMDVSKTIPAASTAGRRGRRNYTAVYGAKLRSPEPRPTLPHQGREITAKTLALVRRVGEQSDMTGALQR